MDITSAQIDNLLSGFKLFAGILITLSVIFLSVMIVSYILTSRLLYIAAKSEKKDNPWFAWVPFLREALAINLGKGQYFAFLVLILMIIPQVRKFAFVVFFAYIVYMKYKIMSTYYKNSKAYLVFSLLVLISLFAKPFLFYFAYIIFTVITYFYLIKATKAIKRN